MQTNTKTIVKIAGAVALAASLFALRAAAKHVDQPRWQSPGWSQPHHGGEWRRPGHRYDRHDIRPFHQVRKRLRHRGYRHIHRINVRRGDYIVRAVNYWGYPVRLRIDGRSLRIVNWRYI